MDFEEISHTESDFDVEMSSLSSTYVPTDGRGKVNTLYTHILLLD